jgi:hypothetical protein
MTIIKWLLTMVFCLFMLPSLAYAQDTKINGPQNYSFILPSNWSTMPVNVVKDVPNDLPSELMTNTDGFDAGYYTTGNDFLSFPFILVHT